MNVVTDVSCKKISIIILSFVFVMSIIFGIIYFNALKIELKGEEYIKLNLGDEYLEKGAAAILWNKDVSNEIKVVGNVDTKKLGTYKIKYTIDKTFEKKSVFRTIDVVDINSPVIELKGSKESIICPLDTYQEEGYYAFDNYDGDITKNVLTEKNEQGIVYTVTDSSGNTTSIERKIIKEDKEKPIISLLGLETIYISANSKYNDPGVNVSDNCDSNISNKIKIKGNVNTNVSGTYKIVYEVEDMYGNKSSVERNVIVYSRANTNNGVNKKGTIYLTFDDGPSATITPGVLKILKEKGVKATFFVINHSDRLNYLIKQAYDDGHTVALHSYTHQYKTIYSSSDAYFNDLKKISDKVKRITGVESKIIRFPGGGSNTVSKNYSKGIMTYLTNEVLNRGYHYFDWNVSSGDAGEAKTTKQVYNNVVKNLKYNRANIVLMHDFENNYKTLNALSNIIDYGLANGYEFLAIDMTTALVRHRPNN